MQRVCFESQIIADAYMQSFSDPGRLLMVAGSTFIRQVSESWAISGVPDGKDQGESTILSA